MTAGTLVTTLVLNALFVPAAIPLGSAVLGLAERLVTRAAHGVAGPREPSLRRFGADTAVAITGIAGPSGGTEDKPVGTVCFTIALTDGESSTRTLRLPGNRSDIRERSTTVAMHMLRQALG